MKKLRFGVLGCAAIADRFVIPAMLDSTAIDLVAVASRSKQKARTFSEKFAVASVVGYEELIRDESIDVIYMPLPTGLHLEWGLKALGAGKHVLFEKSLALNYDDTKVLVNRARQSKLLIDENYMFVDHSQQIEVVHLIARIGKVRAFSAKFGFPPLDKGNFRYDNTLGGGSLLDAGGYVLKSLEVFFPNYKPELVGSQLTYSEYSDIAGSGFVKMRSKDGEGDFPAFLSFGFDNYYQCGIEVWGSKGTIKTDRTFTAGPEVIPKCVFTADGTESILSFEKDDHFIKKLNRFAKEIDGKNYERTYNNILKQASLLEALKENA